MKNELGRWIEKEQKKRNWSQRKLAQEAGISQAPISRIINKVPIDETEPLCGEKVAQALARAFGANPIYVFRLARILKPPPRDRDFSTWLRDELSERNMAEEELASRAQLEPDNVSDLMQGVPPDFRTAQKLANALDLDPLYVQQLAGLVPPGEHALSTNEINLLNDFRELNKAGRQVVADMISSLKENLANE